MHRYAIYYAPATDDPWWQAAAKWLGRGMPDGSFDRDAPGIPGIDRRRLDANTRSARRYGFHATLKAPMRLAERASRHSLELALDGFASRTTPVSVGKLRLALLDGFLALVPLHQSAELTALAARVVAEFEPCRAPLLSEERSRRIGDGKLDPRQIELLEQFGYPYVLERFQFHMTLTDRLQRADQETLVAAASGWFGPLLERQVTLDRLVLFGEPEAGTAFERLSDFPLAGKLAEAEPFPATRSPAGRLPDLAPKATPITPAGRS